MKRIGAVCGGIVMAVCLGAGGAILAAGWFDGSEAHGDVSLASDPGLLHIHDQLGDDSGADEIMFETEENLVPGGTAASWEIALDNVTVAPQAVTWRISFIYPTVTEVVDPGDDCTDTPILTMRIAHDYASQWLYDDVLVGVSPQDLPALPYDGNGNSYQIVVGPGLAEVVDVYLSIPSTFPGECQGGHWNVSIVWTAEII